MRASRSFPRRALAALVALMAIGGLAAGSATAQTAVVPSPKAVIYPGDIIDNGMLADISATVDGEGGPYASSRAELVGKMARRTLLPGRPIPARAIDNPRVVRNGADVQIVYVEGGLTIVAVGSAMQDAGVGEIIKVRNNDSGVIVSGEVRPDGTVRVNGG